MRILATFSLAGVALLSGSLASADTLTLKNGRVMNGTYLGGTAREIRLDLGDHVETIDVEKVSTLQFDNTAPSGESNRQPMQPPREPSGFDRFGGQQGQRADNRNDSRNDSRNDAPRYNDAPRSGMTIPAGTPITVRMIDTVDSETSRLGDTFRASLEDPILINGETIVPRGADVTARLAEDRKSGKISGRTVLTLVLTSITVNGRPVDISTSDVTQASDSRGSRSGKVIGGTTALGAIIGAVAGGGRGAAIGAASGAAVGTGAEVMTKGQRVRIPSESRLTFTLSNDTRI